MLQYFHTNICEKNKIFVFGSWDVGHTSVVFRSDGRMHAPVLCDTSVGKSFPCKISFSRGCEMMYMVRNKMCNPIDRQLLCGSKLMKSGFMDEMFILKGTRWGDPWTTHDFFLRFFSSKTFFFPPLSNIENFNKSQLIWFKINYKITNTTLLIAKFFHIYNIHFILCPFFPF